MNYDYTLDGDEDVKRLDKYDGKFKFKISRFLEDFSESRVLTEIEKIRAKNVTRYMEMAKLGIPLFEDHLGAAR